MPSPFNTTKWSIVPSIKGCNAKHAYSQVGPTVFNGAYSQERVLGLQPKLAPARRGQSDFFLGGGNG